MEHPLVRFETALVDALPEAPCIIATGPLTDPALTKALLALPGLRELHFFDAAAPIVARRVHRHGQGLPRLAAMKGVRII